MNILNVSLSAISLYYYILLGKKSNYVIRFFETWGRNPVFQFLIWHFEDGSAIWGQNDTSDEIDRVSTSDNSTPSGAN